MNVYVSIFGGGIQIQFKYFKLLRLQNGVIMQSMTLNPILRSALPKGEL